MCCHIVDGIQKLHSTFFYSACVVPLSFEEQKVPPPMECCAESGHKPYSTTHATFASQRERRANHDSKLAQREKYQSNGCDRLQNFLCGADRREGIIGAGLPNPARATLCHPKNNPGRNPESPS
jgi:hypothetical protein